MRSLAERFQEKTIITEYFRSLNLGPEHRILDVGCGYGKNIRHLSNCGFNLVGVDVNPQHIDAVCRDGFTCYTPAECAERRETYDALLLCHVIEHFAPCDALHFVDGYLDRLKIGGHVIIVTPLLWTGFYDDFDHVKPYTPSAIYTVFCQSDSQVQYHSRNRLRLQQVRLRRRPGRIKSRLDAWGRDQSRTASLVTRAVSLANYIVFHASGGLLRGETTGWAGLFEKLQD